MPNGTQLPKSFKNGMITWGLGFRQPRVPTTKIQAQISAGLSAKNITFGMNLNPNAWLIRLILPNAAGQMKPRAMIR